MLPGGMMPVTQLIAMIRSTPPQGAAGLLAAMPAERLPVVIAAMRPADIARVLPATRGGLRKTLVASLSTEQLTELVQTSTDQAIALLPTLPHERLAPVVAGLPDEAVSDLVTQLPPDGQSALFAVLAPPRTYTVLSLAYEHDVARALVRSNAEVSVANEPPGGTLLVQSLGWRIVVAARYGDDGSVAIRDAEGAAYHLRANGALAVTDQQPADDVLRYCREARYQGRPIDAVSWADAEDDNAVKRTLVGLFQ
jgi:hypothetical protein